MRNKDEIKEIINYLQATAEKPLVFDEAAIDSAYQKHNDNQSLTIKILSVFGGILSSLAFVVFLLMAGLYDSDLGLLVFGTICITGAIWVNKEYDKIILDTVSVSFFIIGFVLLGFGFEHYKTDETIISIIFIIIACCSMRIVQTYILSFISVLIIHGSVIAIIIQNHNPDMIHLYISALSLLITWYFLEETKIITTAKALSRLYNPVRVGLVISFITGLIFLGKVGVFSITPDYIWLSSVIIISAILYLLSCLFKILGITNIQHKTGIYISSILLLLPTALSPAISGSILIILLSVMVNYKTGLVLGITALIYFISQYYYDLNFSLLTKSILLFSSGLLFISLYLFTHKILTTNEKI